MTDQTRRVWRAGPATLVLVWLFALAAGVAIPVLAYLIYRQSGTPWIPACWSLLTVLALVYAWRFGLHPELRPPTPSVEVVNPFRRHEFDWDDITLIAPGENGLVIGTEDDVAEAWCVQKSNYAARRGRFTRADRIAHELLDILELHDPPLEDEETGLRIRRARPDESRLLTRLERAASEDALSHIFPPEEHPYPVVEVTRRWRGLLVDRHVQVHILELFDTPVGYVAFDDDDRFTTSAWWPPDPPRLRLGAAGVRQPGDLLRRRTREAALGAHRQRGRPGPSTGPTAGPRPRSGGRPSSRPTRRRC